MFSTSELIDLGTIKLVIHPHLESFAAKSLQVDGGILGEISAQVVHHIIETFFATVCTSPNCILEVLAWHDFALIDS